VTLNMNPGEAVYGEKRIEIVTMDVKKEYRQWNPFRSKLASSILGGIKNIYMKPGSKVLYLGAASGTTVSHVSDIVGPEGAVYAVEFSHRTGRELLEVAKKRPNVIPIIEDARKPPKISHASTDGRCYFCRRSATGSSKNYGYECTLFS